MKFDNNFNEHYLENSMNDLKRKMISEAILKYKRIYPCGAKNELSECFTEVDNETIFWFNTEDNTTHLISQRKGLSHNKSGSR
jgi:hypothetical protein